MIAVIDINLNPVLVKLGPISLHWYGVMYVVGIIIALLVVLPFVESRGIRRDRAMELFFPIVIGGLVGGRLWYVLQANFGSYLTHPWRILATWEGGMAFFGAIFGATLTIIFLCRKGNPSVWVILDAGAIFAPLGQAFGRIGNVINGDIVGYKSDCAWCTEYTNRANHFVVQHYQPYQPAAAYELIISLGIFALIYSVRNRMPRPGLLFAIYLALYSITQFGIFFVRDEPIVAIGLKQAQLTGIVTLVIAILLAVYLLERRIPVQVAAAPVTSDSGDVMPQQSDATVAVSMDDLGLQSRADEEAVNTMPSVANDDPAQVPDADAESSSSDPAPIEPTETT